MTMLGYIPLWPSDPAFFPMKREVPPPIPRILIWRTCFFCSFMEGRRFSSRMAFALWWLGLGSPNSTVSGCNKIAAELGHPFLRPRSLRIALVYAAVQYGLYYNPVFARL